MNQSYLEYRRKLKNGSQKASGGSNSDDLPENKYKPAEKGPAQKSPLKRPTKKIKTVSKKRAKQNRAYTPLKKKYMEDHPLCEAKMIGCTGRATDLHHVAGRAGKNLLLTEHFRALCRNCHDLLEVKDKKARKAGLKTSRLGKAKK